MTKTDKTANKAVKADKPVKIKFLTGAESINAAISSIAKRGKGLNKDIHIAAVSTLIHADKHGDITLANRLVEALPETMRKNALRDWYLAFGKFDYDAQNKVLIAKMQAVTNTQEAMAKPFWKFKPEAEYVPFNAVKEVNRLLKRIDNAKTNGDLIPEVLEEALLGVQAALTKPDALAA